MLKTSLLFLGLGLAALAWGDLEITTLDSWTEMQALLKGAVSPDFRIVVSQFPSLVNTLIFALCGCSLGVVLGVVLAYNFQWTPVRLLCAFLRSIHELFWAFLFLPIVGLDAVCGILAIALPYGGTFGKVYAEIRQEADPRPEQSLPPSGDRLSRFLFAVVPSIYSSLKGYTGYRLECALRSSAIMGFIGLPTLGYHLETAFREGMYSEAAALLYLFFLVIGSLRLWARTKIIWLPILLSWLLVSKDVSLSRDNILRFFTHEIIPWPIRQQSTTESGMRLLDTLAATWSWTLDLFQRMILPGIGNTLLLTQMSLAGAGLLALLGIPLAAKPFGNRFTRMISHGALIVLRTTPEYILAYIFLQLWGPSMLPAALALILHNGAILTFITSTTASRLPRESDSPSRYTDSYGYTVLPRIYGQFLAFALYRWEIIMRESAILGILGIATLGFYIDSAMADDHLDVAFLLIMVTAMLNILIDTLSQYLRKRLHLTTSMHCTALE